MNNDQGFGCKIALQPATDSINHLLDCLLDKREKLHISIEHLTEKINPALRKIQTNKSAPIPDVLDIKEEDSLLGAELKRTYLDLHGMMEEIDNLTDRVQL